MTDFVILEREKDLRKAWGNEAYDFTPWLAEKKNLDFLCERIGLSLTPVETESSVDEFFADIVCTVDGSGDVAIIENQLEETDHDHLGKLITYASGKDAKYVIWTVRKSRDAHIKAIQWLNEHTDIDFFLVEIELWKLPDGKYSPNFYVVEKPVNWGRRVQKGANWHIFSSFWGRLDEVASEYGLKTHGESNRSAYDISIPKSSIIISLTASVSRKQVSAGIYIRDDIELYESILNSSEILEKALGTEDIVWSDTADKARSIRIYRQYDITDSTESEKAVHWLLNEASKLKAIAEQFM